MKFDLSILWNLIFQNYAKYPNRFTASSCKSSKTKARVMNACLRRASHISLRRAWTLTWEIKLMLPVVEKQSGRVARHRTQDSRVRRFGGKSGAWLGAGHKLFHTFSSGRWDQGRFFTPDRWPILRQVWQFITSRGGWYPFLIAETKRYIPRARRQTCVWNMFARAFTCPIRCSIGRVRCNWCWLRCREGIS